MCEPTRMFAKTSNELYFHWLKNHPIFSEPIQNCITLIFSSFTSEAPRPRSILSRTLEFAEIGKVPPSISQFQILQFQKTVRTWILKVFIVENITCNCITFNQSDFNS